jgi:hypothetical protein
LSSDFSGRVGSLPASLLLSVWRNRSPQLIEELLQIILAPSHLLGYITGFLEQKPPGKCRMGKIRERIGQKDSFELLSDGLHLILRDEVPLLFELKMNAIPYTVSEDLKDFGRDPVLRGLGERYGNDGPKPHVPSISSHPARLIPKLQDKAVGQPPPFEKPSFHLAPLG